MSISNKHRTILTMTWVHLAFWSILVNVIYAIGAFASLDFNLFEWHWFVRLLAAISTAVMTLLVGWSWAIEKHSIEWRL